MGPTILRPGQRLILPGVRVLQPSMAGGVSAPPSSNMMAWFRANDTATIFQDSALTTPASANNDPIGGWKDKSGNNNPATQATASARPLLKTAFINGKNAILSDGVNDILATGTIAHGIGTGNFYYAIVLNRVAVGTAYPCIAANGGGTPGMYYRTSAANRVELEMPTSRLFAGTLATGTNVLIEFWRDAGTVKMSMNAAQDASTFADSTSVANATTRLFADGVGDFGNIYMAEFLFYNAFSAGQQASVRAYLNGEYALY